MMSLDADYRNFRNANVRFIAIVFYCSLLFLLSVGNLDALEKRKEILRGPLQISADETVSRERGKLIEATGNVFVRYEMESGDLLESFSRFARYNEKEYLGELWGNPKAIWEQKGAGQSRTTLTAEKITLKIKDSELIANGNVIVLQTSSTLKANEIRFFNSEKKLVAEGGRPIFSIQEPQQKTTISAEKIVGLTEKKQIQFNEKVQGVVEFVTK